MKRMTIIGILFVLLSSTVSALDQSISRSVVKINTTTTKDGKIFTEAATGWAWQKPMTVVTALHAVAGKNVIEVSNHQGKTTTARIVKVVKEGDLALLRLDGSLDLIPLSTGTAQHNSKETFQVVGYPHNIPTMAAFDVKFATSFSGRPILNHLIQGTSLEAVLTKQGYPVPQTYIYRLSSTIQPGHSGAPIVRDNGVVIGIADGGLKKGTARLNWAIPAQQYVSRLSTSSETIPRTISKQSDLFSAKTLVSSVGSPTPATADAESISDPSGDVTVHKIWNASLAEIFFTLEEADQDDVRDIFEDFTEDEADYFAENLRYDVYEDYNTGATFAVPEGAEVTYEDDTFVVSLGRFEFGFIPQNTDSFEGAVQMVRLYADEMLKLYPSAQPYDEDEEDGDRNEQWYNLAKMRVIQEGNERMLFAVGGEALGANAALLDFTGPLPESLNEEEMIRFLGFVVGLEIISFAGY